MNKYLALLLILNCPALRAMDSELHKKFNERERNADILAQWSTLHLCPEEHQEGIIKSFVATYYGRFSRLENLIDSKDIWGNTLLTLLVFAQRIRSRNDPLYRFFKDCNADTSFADAMLPIEPQSGLHQLVSNWKLMYKESTPYEILNISPSATQNDIKKAYRKEGLLWHPDRHSKKTPAEQEYAKTKFQAISAANVLLTDVDAKESYDKSGHKPEKPAAAPIIPAGDKEFKPTPRTNALIVSAAAAVTGVIFAIYYNKQYYQNPEYKTVTLPMDAHV